MTRINDRLLVQNVDGDVVIMDERNGDEIVIPRSDLWRAAMAVVAAAVEPEDVYVTDPRGGVELGKMLGNRPEFVIVDELTRGRSDE